MSNISRLNLDLIQKNDELKKENAKLKKKNKDLKEYNWKLKNQYKIMEIQKICAEQKIERLETQLNAYKLNNEEVIKCIENFENKFKGYAVFPDKRFLDLEALKKLIKRMEEKK